MCLRERFTLDERNYPREPTPMRLLLTSLLCKELSCPEREEMPPVKSEILFLGVKAITFHSITGGLAPKYYGSVAAVLCAVAPTSDGPTSDGFTSAMATDGNA